MNSCARFDTRLGFEALEPRAMLAADPGWAFGLGGAGSLSADSTVNIGPDNNVYVTGSFMGTIDVDPGPGTAAFTTPTNVQNGFIAKYTPQGALVWGKRFGGTGSWGEFSKAVDFDGAGNVYVAGFSNSPSPQFGNITLTNQDSRKFRRRRVCHRDFLRHGGLRSGR
jgi:hypothetical protein